LQRPKAVSILGEEDQLSAASPHLSALELEAVLREAASAGEAVHLADCVECRVRAARMARASELPVPSRSALARITESQTRVGPALAAASLPTSEDGSPRAGELWRVGGDEALLVWVRRVLDGAVDVLPVVLDTDLGDEQTLLLPASASPLALDLAVVTSVQAHVHPDAFLSRVDDLGEQVTADIAEVMTAAREGRPAQQVQVGPVVLDPDDQRIEYQQTLADVLAGLGPAAWTRRQQRTHAEAAANPDLYRLVKRELVLRHHRCSIHESLQVLAVLPNGALLRAVARIGYADTSVLLAVHRDWPAERLVDLATACRRLVAQEPGASAVAVCGSAPEYLTAVVDASAMRSSYESPSGRLQPPLTGMEPMHVIDALAKYLETHSPLWEDVDAEIVISATDLGAAARIAAAAAVADLSAQGRRAVTPAKKQAWSALPAATAEALAVVVDRLVAGESSAAVLDALLGEDPR
jgi:hypothetical protein